MTPARRYRPPAPASLLILLSGVVGVIAVVAVVLAVLATTKLAHQQAAIRAQQTITAGQAYENCVSRRVGVPIFVKVLRRTHVASRAQLRAYLAARPRRCIRP